MSNQMAAGDYKEAVTSHPPTMQSQYGVRSCSNTAPYIISTPDWPGSTTTPIWIDNGDGTGLRSDPQIVPPLYSYPTTTGGLALRRPPTSEELDDPVFADLWEEFKNVSCINADHIHQMIKVVQPYFNALEEANRILAHPKKEKTEEDELREQMSQTTGQS